MHNFKFMNFIFKNLHMPYNLNKNTANERFAIDAKNLQLIFLVFDFYLLFSLQQTSLKRSVEWF